MERTGQMDRQIFRGKFYLSYIAMYLCPIYFLPISKLKILQLTLSKKGRKKIKGISKRKTEKLAFKVEKKRA